MPKRSVRISDKLDSRLQTAVKDHAFATPSDFIRSAVEKALKDDEDLLGMEERIAASCGRINKDIYRVMRAQQALFAFVDAFVKIFLSACQSHPPSSRRRQSRAQGSVTNVWSRVQGKECPASRSSPCTISSTTWNRKIEAGFSTAPELAKLRSAWRRSRPSGPFEY